MSDTKLKQSTHDVFEGRTKDIKTHYFIYGRGMQQKCLSSSKEFTIYIGSKYGASVSQSITNGTLTVAEMAEPTLYTTEAEYNAESWAVQQAWKLDTADYRKYVRQITSDLTKSYLVLWGQCTLALQTVIERDDDFIAMRAGDVKVLYAVIQKICHGSTHHKNCFMSSVESVFNFHLIKGEDYSDMSKYIESFEKRYEIFTRSGWSVASTDMRDLYIKELEEKRMKDHPSYQKLVDWRNETIKIVAGGTSFTYDATKLSDGMEVLNDKYKAYVFIKRAGFKYENFRIDLKNNFEAGKDSYPDNVIEASRRLDNWQPLYVPPAKKNEALQFHQSRTASGEQHYEHRSCTAEERHRAISSQVTHAATHGSDSALSSVCVRALSYGGSSAYRT